jgi:hypothetical protein
MRATMSSVDAIQNPLFHATIQISCHYLLSKSGKNTVKY